MNPTEVKSTFNRNHNTEEQTTTGTLGTVPYMVVKRTDFAEPDRTGGRQYTVRHSIYIRNDENQWVAASEQRSREALIAFGFIRDQD